MMEHIYLKFADRIGSIRTLLQKDATFEEICADYEEICTWLSSQQESTVLSTEEIEYARELIKDLEDEINEMLRRED
jgi:uncharacterized protein YdcH (DUF465 family)